MYLDHLIDVALAQAPAVEPRRISRFEPSVAPLLEQETMTVDGGGMRSDTPPALAGEADRASRAEPRVAAAHDADATRATESKRPAAHPPQAALPVVAREEQPAVPVQARPHADASEPAHLGSRLDPRLAPATPAAREIHRLTERTEVWPHTARDVPATRDVVHEREIVREIETRVATAPAVDVSLEVARALAALPRPVELSPTIAVSTPAVQPRRDSALPPSMREVATRPPTSARGAEPSRLPAVEPHVHVTIGRVEVRATVSTPRGPRRRPEGPQQGLSDYLRRREGR